MDRDESEVVLADLGGGRMIQVEVRRDAVVPAPGDPEEPVSLLDKFKKSDGPPPSFDSVTDSIEAVATKVTQALEKVKPDTTTVEFGVDIGVETGGLTALLAKGTGSATLKITLEWSQNGAG